MLSAERKSGSLRRLASASEAARLRGDYAIGAGLAREAAALARQLGLPGDEAEMLSLLANQLLRTGDIEDAALAAGDAAAISAQANDEAGRSRALTIQSMAYLELGLPEEALEALAVSLDIAQRLRQPDLLFWTYNRIGNAHSQLGKHIEARSFLRRALPFSAGLGAEAKFCILNNLACNAADIATQASESGAAALLAEAVTTGLRYALDAIELARAAAHPYREAICLGNHAMLLAFSGDEIGATRAITRSHTIASQKGYASLKLDAECCLARIAMRFGDIPTAIARYEAVLPGLIESDEKPVIVEAHRLLADLYQQHGDAARALSHYKAYHSLESRTRSSIAETRVRLVTSMTELSAALLEAERAKLETRLHQMQLAELESEKRDLLLRTHELDRKAHEDDLTGLKNRRYANGALAERLAACPPGQRIFVGIIDADHFKAINDRFGHSIGDDVLRLMAGLLSADMAVTDFAARLGGEEFLLLLTGDASTSIALCEDIRRRVESFAWSNLGAELAVSVSIGLTAARAGEAVNDVLARADAALYRAKSGGRNRLTTDL